MFRTSKVDHVKKHLKPIKIANKTKHHKTSLMKKFKGILNKAKNYRNIIDRTYQNIT